MRSSIRDDSLTLTTQRLDYTIDRVIERGWSDSVVQDDDYSVLIQEFEFKKLVTLQLYECYFTPRRHEFELQLIAEIVEAVAKSKGVGFVGTAAAAGIAGNTAYQLTRQLVRHIALRFQSHRRRAAPFRELQANLKAVRAFFSTTEKASLDRVAAELSIEPEKLEPLLKLLGFKCRRRRKRAVWIRPEPW